MKLLRGGCLVVIAIAAGIGLSFGCGGSGSTPPPTTTPVSINTLDGQTNIPVDSTFQYAFSKAVSTTTVTAGNFFIVPAEAAAANVIKVTFDPTVCNAASAIAATITCSTTAACDLDPTADLQQGTLYAACLSTDIKYGTGESFEGFMATFTTAGGVVPPAPTAALKLIRLDGTPLDLTAKPIPLWIAVQATFDQAMDPATVEAAMTVTDDAGTAVPGVFAWNTGNTVATYTLSQNLKYQKTYHVKIAATAASKSTMAAVDQTFKTMTKGDVNGDGIPDILVSAANLSHGADLNAGAVYVFSGATLSHATVLGDALATIYGANGDQLGNSVAMAGDVNGDGYYDIMISTVVGNHGALVGTGIVYIFSGKDLSTSTTTANALATIYGAAAGDRFGNVVSGMGDFNNDGYADVMASSDTPNGDVYLFSGKDLQTTMIASGALVKLSGLAGGDGFGYSLSGVGDVNGDGFDDFMIGAGGVTVGGKTGAGKAYIFSGNTISSASTIGDAFSTIVSAIPDNDVGLAGSCSGAGDVNGDGVPDIIVGASGANADTGAAYVFSGATLVLGMTTGAAIATINGDAPGDGLGFVAGVGDVNGDGIDDVGVGASAYSGNKGASYVFSGTVLSGTIGTDKALATLIGANANDYLSYLAGIGDIDGDGKADIAISANNYLGGTSQGIMYVFLGNVLGTSATLSDALVTIPGIASSEMGYRMGSIY